LKLRIETHDGLNKRIPKF